MAGDLSHLLSRRGRLGVPLESRQVGTPPPPGAISFGGGIPGSRFLVEGRPLLALRLAFSQVPLEAIPEGARRLGRALERLAAQG